MTNLLINIDHVATLRNARRETFPDPVRAALECELGGADGIVFHLREDRRHINDTDVRLLKEKVRTKLDFELSVAPDVVGVCCEIVPDLATLVPERREEITTEGGLDAVANRTHLAPVIERLYDAGVTEVALFLDPEADQIDAAAELGANVIELHTGDYANAHTDDARHEILSKLAAAAERAHENNMAVHAGHGLDYSNYELFRESVPHVAEVSIGFAVIARAIFTGLRSAVADIRKLVKQH